MFRTRLSALAIALTLTACANVAPEHTTGKSTTGMPSNPFFAASTLPFQAPPFDRITDADFQPAIEEGMRQQLAEVDAIANHADAPSFDNTIVAMERSGALLTRVTRVFDALTSANTNDTLQKVQSDEAPRRAAHHDAIHLNPKLFARIRTLYDGRATLGLNAEQQTLLERYHTNFVRAGAQLAAADQTTLRALNEEESTLSTEFQKRLLAATKAGALVVKDKNELAGFGAADLDAAAAAASERKLDGEWLLPLQNTTQQPALASLSDRVVRARLLDASMTRAEHGDTNDTRAVIERLAQLRAERARLLGYPNFAAYALADQMAKTPAAAEQLMTSMVPAATAKARGEAAKMQALIDRQKGGFALAASDWDFYAEQVRHAEYDLDDAQIKPYLELDRVLHDGVFFAANKMYGLTFKERHDIPVYQPDVRVFDVFEADGRPLALFYADFFKRDNKSGGAWMDVFVEQDGLTGTKPVVFNVCNFTKPAAGQPALISFDDATTMFHEFGHALHGMFSNVEYPTLAGTNTPRDFVEYPSQFNEHWALEPSVIASYAKHYQTGAPMPQALVDKIRKSHTFNQGYATTEYLAAALLDMAWHTLSADAPQQAVDAFETQALKRFHVDLAQVPPRYRSSYFSHIWGGGYAAGYYAYLWAEVLDDDTFYWFRDHGGMTRANGQRFRDMILSRGSTQDMATIYRNFRGADPSVEPLLHERGLK